MDFFTLNYTKKTNDCQLVSGFNMVTKADMCILNRVVQEGGRPCKKCILLTI
jgi:hypothetical protein